MNDLISRAEAIKVLKSNYDLLESATLRTDKARRDEISAMMAKIMSLPSADRPTGEWVWSDEDASWKCGCCDCVFEEIDWKPDYNFCPNCGAKMCKGGENE